MMLVNEQVFESGGTWVYNVSAIDERGSAGVFCYMARELTENKLLKARERSMNDLLLRLRVRMAPGVH